MRKFLKTLEQLTESIENADTRGDTSFVLANITNFQFVSYLNLWGEILPEMDKTQKYLQSKGLGLDQSVAAVQSLQSFSLEWKWKNGGKFDNFCNSSVWQFEYSCGPPCEKKTKNGLREDHRCWLLSWWWNTTEYVEIVDRLNTEMSDRFEQINPISCKFASFTACFAGRNIW